MEKTNSLYSSGQLIIPIPQPRPPATLYTVDGLCVVEDALTPGGVRTDVFHRRNNGLEESGALVWRGRRLLIHRERYIAWMMSHGTHKGRDAV